MSFLNKYLIDKSLKINLLILIIGLVFSYSAQSQCVNPAWSAANWNSYVVGFVVSKGGKDYKVHTLGQTHIAPDNAVHGGLSWALLADPCDQGVTAPVLSLTGSSNVTCSAADFTANITSDGSAAITARGFIYGTSAADVTASTEGGLVGTASKAEELGASLGTGVFTIAAAGLSSSVTYYVKAFAKNSQGSTYTGSVSFFTCAVIPTLTTTAISALSCETVTSGGDVTANGGSTVTSRGVCWSTVPSPTIANSKTSDGSGIGAYASAVTGLTDGTLYYLRAYATNGVGTAYGNQISFTTASACTPTYYSCATPNSWSLKMDCSTNDGAPGSTHNAVLRHDWFNFTQAGSYNLANLAWGQTGYTWFNAKPKKLTIQSGGRGVFTTSSFVGLPATFSLVVDPGGIFSSYTSLEVINSFENNGSVHLFGAVTNGNNITGTGDICYSGNFENSTLGGSMNGAFLNASEADLIAGFFTTDNAAIGGKCGSLGGLLPIELISFTGKHKGDAVELSWATLSETNNEFFMVEASRDGFTWEMIDMVDGAGNSSSYKSYSTEDYSISFTDKKYYRLKQVDFDGSMQLSAVLIVPITVSNDYLNVYDNGSNLVADLYSEYDQTVGLTILDMRGKIVTVVDAVELKSKESINMTFTKNNLSPGVYLCKVESVSKYNAKRFIIR